MTYAPATSKPSSHPAGAIDLLDQASPEVLRLYDEVRKELLGSGIKSLIMLQRQGQRLMTELGVAVLHHQDQDSLMTVPFDPFPRIIGQADWEFISHGVQQRLAIWNALLRDLYGSQEVLKAGILPLSWVLDDPGYHRGAMDVPVPEQTFAHIAAFDLQLNAEGQWVVQEDHVANTNGAAYALQARNVLSQIFPELLEIESLERVQDYPTELLEVLRSHAPLSASEPRVVVFSPGPSSPHYYEHSSLARQMGIPLVLGNDLIVLNSRVYLKTIGGLEPIDVIYRRLEDDQLDPLEYNTASQVGLGGLMNCVRQSTVTVANAFGSAISNNRSFAALWPKLAKFYLNEPLVLHQNQRLVLSDMDQCEHFLSHPERYLVREVNKGINPRSWNCAQLSSEQQELLYNQVRRQPYRFVADVTCPANLLPTVALGGLAPRPVELRVFASSGRSGRVHTNALTRFFSDNKNELEGIKDTWILQRERPTEKEQPVQITTGHRRLRLGSRTADHLFWMARYAERAENVTRILQVLQLVQLEGRTRKASPTWDALWESLAAATGHSKGFYKKTRFPRGQTLHEYLLRDLKNRASVASCIELCRSNANFIREAIPPELFAAIQSVHMVLDPEESGEAETETTKLADELDEITLEERILAGLNAVSGAANNNMVRGDGWYFWNMGTQIERALCTVQVIRPILQRRINKATGELERTTINLDAMLGMLASRYAYRSLYQSRPGLYNSTRLVLQDPQVPRSVLYCLRAIQHALSTTRERSQSQPSAMGIEDPAWICARLISNVEFANLLPFFQPAPAGRPPGLRTYLDGLIDQLNELANAVSDHYLNHQAFNILR